MINREWLVGSGVHRIYPAAADVDDGAGHVLVTAYAVQRPDGEWAIMAINKDQQTSHRVRLLFSGKDKGMDSHLSGTVHVAIFGSEQYAWHPGTRDFTAHLPMEENSAAKIYRGGVADPDGPIAKRDVAADASTSMKSRQLRSL